MNVNLLLNNERTRIMKITMLILKKVDRINIVNMVAKARMIVGTTINFHLKNTMIHRAMTSKEPIRIIIIGLLMTVLNSNVGPLIINMVLMVKIMVNHVLIETDGENKESF